MCDIETGLARTVHLNGGGAETPPGSVEPDDPLEYLPTPAHRTESFSSGAIRQSILVLDDNADLVEVLVAALEFAGHSAEGYTDFRDAAARMQCGPSPSLLIVDYRMPELSGLHAIESFRRSGFDARVICFTAAHRSHVDTEALRRLGVDVVLPKPMPLESLLAVIAEVSGGGDAPVEARRAGT
jgi:CheY-like chemotaxis protein